MNEKCEYYLQYYPILAVYHLFRLYSWPLAALISDSLDSDGNIHITGYGALNQLSQIENHKEEWTDIVAISTGGGSNEKGKRGHTVALKNDGTVVAVGDNGFGQCNVSEWTDIVAIATDDFYTV